MLLGWLTGILAHRQVYNMFSLIFSAKNSLQLLIRQITEFLPSNQWKASRCLLGDCCLNNTRAETNQIWELAQFASGFD